MADGHQLVSNDRHLFAGLWTDLTLPQREGLIRLDAAGKVSLAWLQCPGFDENGHILDHLGDPRLKFPICSIIASLYTASAKRARQTIIGWAR